MTQEASVFVIVRTHPVHELIGTYANRVEAANAMTYGLRQDIAKQCRIMELPHYYSGLPVPGTDEARLVVGHVTMGTYESDDATSSDPGVFDAFVANNPWLPLNSHDLEMTECLPPLQFFNEDGSINVWVAVKSTAKQTINLDGSTTDVDLYDVFHVFDTNSVRRHLSVYEFWIESMMSGDFNKYNIPVYDAETNELLLNEKVNIVGGKIIRVRTDQPMDSGTQWAMDHPNVMSQLDQLHTPALRPELV